MKATLEFNLDERDDIVAHNRCVKALDMAMAIYDIEQELRSKMKYSELSDVEYEAYKKIRSSFYDILNERGVNIDDLII